MVENKLQTILTSSMLDVQKLVEILIGNGYEVYVDKVDRYTYRVSYGSSLEVEAVVRDKLETQEYTDTDGSIIYD